MNGQRNYWKLGALALIVLMAFYAGATIFSQRPQASPVSASGGADPSFSSNGVGLPCFTSDPSPLPAVGTEWCRSDLGVIRMETSGGPITIGPVGSGTTGLANPVGQYTFLINTTTISATQYYYAYNSNGRLTYGGPTNEGGATGTNFTMVANDASAGNNRAVVIAPGSYTSTGRLLSTTYNGTTLTGAGGGYGPIANVPNPSSTTIAFTRSTLGTAGISIGTSSTHKITGAMISRLTLVGASTSGTSVGVYLLLADTPQLYDVTVTNFAIGLEDWAADSARIIMSDFQVNGIGAEIYGQGYTIFAQNEVADNVGNGLVLGISGGGSVTDSIISQNIFARNTNCITSYNAGAVNTTISYNMLNSCSEDGILIYGLNGNSIIGNTILNPGTGHTGDQDCIKVDGASYTVVEANNCRGEPANTVHAVEEISPADYNLVVGNVASGTSSTAYVTVGAHDVVANNLG